MFPFENILPTQPPQDDLFSDPYLQISRIWNFQGNSDKFSTIVPSVGTLLSSDLDLAPPEVDPIEKEKEAKRKQIQVLLAELQCLEAKP